MLLFLDKSIATANLESDLDACNGITEAFLAVHRGDHYVLADRELLELLHKSPHIAASTRATISSIKNNLSTLGGLKYAIRSKVVITNSNSDEILKTSDLEWKIPLKKIGKIGIRRSVLIAENLNDAKIYCHAAKQAKIRCKLPGEIAIEPISGGGSTISEVFNDQCTNGKWGFCITDGDHTFPSSSPSPSSLKCESVSKNHNFISRHFKLPVLEIENAIPFGYIREIISPELITAWDWHINRVLGEQPDLHAYCDLKKGTTFRSITEIPDSTPKKNYWNAAVQNLVSKNTILIPCFKHGECRKDLSSECECTIAAKVGKNCLIDVLEFLEKNSSHRTLKLVTKDSNVSLWFDIGEDVLNWGIAPKATRI